jgi:hypothetical protein
LHTGVQAEREVRASSEAASEAAPADHDVSGLRRDLSIAAEGASVRCVPSVAGGVVCSAGASQGSLVVVAQVVAVSADGDERLRNTAALVRAYLAHDAEGIEALVPGDYEISEWRELSRDLVALLIFVVEDRELLDDALAQLLALRRSS